MRKESDFQADLIQELKERYPGCYVWKQDAKQGIPDLVIFYGDRWAMLECKRHSKAHHQQNQDYYIEKFNEMSFASFIFPENKEEVLNDLDTALRVKRQTRIPRRK